MEIPPDYFHFLSFLSVHTPEVQVSIFPAQYKDFPWGWSAAGSKLVGCCSSLLWRSFEGFRVELSLPDLWKWNILWNMEKISILFKSTSCIRQGNSSPCYWKDAFFLSFHFLFHLYSTYCPLKHLHNPFTAMHEYLLASDIFLFASSQSSREETGIGIKTQLFSLVTQEALVDQSQLPKCCLAIPSLKVSSVNVDI